MSIEDSIFERYSPDFYKLEKYGFKKNKDGFSIEKLFKDNAFKAAIQVNTEGKVFGIVYDEENGEEFLPLRIAGNSGAFVGEVRQLYEELLTDIRDKCFIRKYFIYPQSNRIIELIIKKYGDEPEFLWEKFKGSGIVRNPETKKWYLVILDTDRSKIQKNREGLIEIAVLKLDSNKAKEITKEENFYPGYHMNKKYWITVILDDSVEDEKIMELIEESYGFSKKK